MIGCGIDGTNARVLCDCKKLYGPLGRRTKCPTQLECFLLWCFGEGRISVPDEITWRPIVAGSSEVELEEAFPPSLRTPNQELLKSPNISELRGHLLETLKFHYYFCFSKLPHLVRYSRRVSALATIIQPTRPTPRRRISP